MITWQRFLHHLDLLTSGLCFAEAIAALKEREPGTFLIRDSNSFQGAYGLALKVATPPSNVNHSSKGNHDNVLTYPVV